MTNGNSPAGWYQDPTGQGQARYWNGTSWTQSVFRDGTNINIAIDPSQAQQPPVPGTQMQLPTQAPVTRTVVEQKSGGSPAAIIFGAVAVILGIILIVVIVNSGDSDDAPTPGTDGPAVTQPAAPATEAPAEDG